MADRPTAHSPVAKVAWVVAGAVCLFAAENVWIDPWIARRSNHRFPSLVPDPLGGTWFLALLAVGISLILVVFCQVLLMRDRQLAPSKKLSTAVLVLAAAVLSGEWFVATGGTALLGQTPQKKRTVTLSWRPSTSKDARYNVYRGRSPGVHPDKLNPQPISALTFTDATVESGVRYYYVVRAVDADGKESVDSAEFPADIP
jgi:hypothetical protein